MKVSECLDCVPGESWVTERSCPDTNTRSPLTTIHHHQPTLRLRHIQQRLLDDTLQRQTCTLTTIMSSSDIDLDQMTSSTCIELTPTTNIPQHQSTHGLSYDNSFLSSLPVLSERPHPHQPIRAITAPQFRQLHTTYLTTHAPDSVIFPFLHGLEGNNYAQNAFFANANNAPWKENHNPDPLPVPEDGAEGKAAKGRIYPEIPRFRGLVWVAASDPSSPSISTNDISSDDYTDSSSSDNELDPSDDYSAVAGIPGTSPSMGT